MPNITQISGIEPLFLNQNSNLSKNSSKDDTKLPLKNVGVGFF